VILKTFFPQQLLAPSNVLQLSPSLLIFNESLGIFCLLAYFKRIRESFDLFLLQKHLASLCFIFPYKKRLKNKHFLLPQGNPEMGFCF